MLQISRLQLWLIAAFCCAAISGLAGTTTAAEPNPAGRAQVKIMFMIDEVDEKGIQAAEIVISRAFASRGYNILNRDIVAQTRRRNEYLRQRYEAEAAKRLGSFLGADIVITGKSKAWVLEEDSELVGKFKRSEADVGARAIIVKSGREIVAEEARAKKAFDATGQIALRMAAEALADKLIKGIEGWLTRPSVDYHLITTPTSQTALQEKLRDMPGVKQVEKISGGEYKVAVDKEQNIRFQTTILSPPSESGSSSIRVVGREGEKLMLGPDNPLRYKPGYRKSWGVVIGINKYQKWEELSYAVNDALATEKILKKLGFNQVITILDSNATKKNIERVLGDELKGKTDKEDRVFIFFAGHGQTENLEDNKKEGYIIPVDGERENYYSSGIRMSDLRDLADRIPAKHIFYAMDSCFSGLLLHLRGETEDPTAVRAVQVLTAGGQGELAREQGGHGVFTKVLLTGLEGEADVDGNGFITARELFQFVTPRVREGTQNSQNPEFGWLRGSGEFSFDRKP